MSAPAYRADGATVGPEAFYTLACDPQRSVVVEACAGAGKTWMLVSRILRALLAGAEPQQILAITFTRKAAGEMRERLADWLREFAHASEAERLQALQQRGMTAQAAAEAAPRLAALHQQLLTARRRVEIRTFHGWFSQLLQAAPIDLLAELGLSPGLELIEDVADLRADVFRRFHAAVAADAGLREDFFSLVRERGRSQLRKWLEAAWTRRVEVESADAAGTLASSVPPAGACWPEFAGLDHPAQRVQAPRVRELLLGVAASLGAQSAATPRKQATGLEQALSLADARQSFAAVRAALLTQKGEPRKGLQAPGLDEALAHIGSIQVAIEQQQAHEDHARMARLARVLLQQYERLKRQRGLADMADLERCALHLLQDSALSGWVQERLDQRIRHVLIDEFQDTSPLQWRTLHGWLSGYAGAGGGASGQRPLSVFIVGDPKQSIYRFRGADPRVFAAARAFVAEALGGVVLECDHTRRNAPEVLQAVNTVFERAQHGGHFEGFRAHTTGAAAGAPGAMRLPRIERPPREAAGEASGAWRDSLSQPRHEPEEGLRQQEARQVAEAVRGLIAQGMAPGDIQVLARKRAVLAQAAAALQALGLPHVAPEDNLLMASPEVRDLVAVLDVLASPGHDLSLAHALRSPMFSATDDDLLALSAEAAGGGWWAALQRLSSASPALQRAATLLGRWAQAMHRLPPHDLLDRIVADGELVPRLLAAVPAPRRAAAMQSVHALLNTALGLDGARYASIYGFVRALKRRALTVSAGAVADAVQLLTVHGAKGLEARAVILMDCDAPAAKAETATVLVEWPVDDEAPARCAFVASEARCPPSLVSLLERERAAREREEVNGLYVAMTRAREQLVLSAVAPHASPHPVSWWALAGEACREWAPIDTAAAAPEAAADEAVGYLDLPTLAPVAASPAPDRTARPADNPLAKLGEAMHRLLEWATEPDAAPVEDLARAAAAAFGLPAESAQDLRARAQAVLHSAEARAFFDAGRLAWAGNEVSLLDGDTTLRLDRLVAFDHDGHRTWWVLDYKLQSTPEAVPAYQAQLARYREVLQRLQPADEVRAAFITAAGRVVELAATADER